MCESYGILRVDPITTSEQSPTARWNDNYGDVMALRVATGAPTMFIRREAYEKSGLTRASIDEKLGLTPDEFRVEGDLIAIGPIYGGGRDALGDLIAEIEALGLV